MTQVGIEDISAKVYTIILEETERRVEQWIDGFIQFVNTNGLDKALQLYYDTKKKKSEV